MRRVAGPIAAIALAAMLALSAMPAAADALPGAPAAGSPAGPAKGRALAAVEPAPGPASAAAEPANDPPPPADPDRTLVDRGWQELRYANWPRALELLEQARTRCAKRENQAEARFALGTLWQIRQPGGDARRAEALYDEVARRYADTPAAPWAHLALARLADTPEYESRRDIERARRLYQEIVRAFPRHPAADEAALRIAMTYLDQVGDRAAEDIGADLLRRYVADFPDNYLVHVMHLVLGDLAQRREDYRAAVDHWVRADPGVRGTADRAALYYKIGTVAERHLKDYALAARWYERVVTDVQRENRYYVSKVAAERCRRLAEESARGGAPPAASPAPRSREDRP